jgi:FkbH-like protein
LARAQLDRQAARKKSVSEAEFLASLATDIQIHQLQSDEMERVVELFQRTTQFNTTGAKFSAAELEALSHDPAARIFTARVKDRFGDHGLVGAAVVRGGEVAGLVLSCRVLGMGVEHEFMRRIMAALAKDHRSLSGRIIETARNIPVRNIYRDHGFSLEDGAWRRTLKEPVAT